MNKPDIYKKAVQSVKKYDMLSSGDTVLIGLSGGADSVFLALFLLSLSQEYNLTLKCAHIEHGIRGSESVQDCEFCREFCRLNNIEFHAFSINAPAEAAAQKVGIEEYSRRRRYEFFDSIPCDKIATAHNLSDNVETILFRLARGSSLRGAAGIPPKRGKIIRPLIEISGEEIRTYLSENSVHYRIDKTNFENDYSRNYIRNSIVPLFAKINGDFENAFGRFARCAAADSAYLDALAEAQYKQIVKNGEADIKKLADCAPSIQTRVIAELIQKNGAPANDYNISGVQRLLDTPSKFQLGAGLYAISAAGRLRIARIDENSENNEFHFKSYIIDYKEFLNRCELSPKDLDFYCDCDKIIGNVSVRRRVGGDFIAPFGRGCTKTLKKLFNELHIPPEKRGGIAVIADGGGVIGVSGICVDERAAVTPATEKVFIIELCTED